MNIVITTAIYPPEVGGPSFYAKSLKEALERAGHTVQVVLYASLKKWPTGLRHFFYALKVLHAARGADGIIVLDTFSTAVPVGLVAPFISAPILCRVGGDFVWESYTERTREAIPLPEFYSYKHAWNLKEKVALRLIRFALRQMMVVFSSDWQKELWRAPYSLEDARVHVIENALPPRVHGAQPTMKNYLFFGRPIFLKNAELFGRAFARAKKERPELQLEIGTLAKEELMTRLREAYAVVLPSISDVTPNTILEAIQYGKPFLLTKYSGYAERFKDLGVIVDPRSEDDLVRGILALADDTTYERLSHNIAAFTDVRTYDDIAVEFVTLLSRS